MRPATCEDADDVLVLVRDCVDDMRRCGIEQWDDAYPDRMTVEEDIRRCEAFVATLQTRLVGYVALGVGQDPDYAEVPWEFTAGPAVVIHRLMVDPEYQGRGFAKVLMSFAENHALTSGYRIVRLDAFLGNPRALHLYERLGYRDAGTLRHRTGQFRCFERELPTAG
jgi:ribosomal protein S18 acetylase RimI-like enzyme